MKKRIITILIATIVTAFSFSSKVYAAEVECEEEITDLKEETNDEAISEDIPVDLPDDSLDDSLGEPDSSEADTPEDSVLAEEVAEDIPEESAKNMEDNTDMDIETSPADESESSEESPNGTLVEVVEKTHLLNCIVNIYYEKEFCEAYYEGAETTTISLDTSFEVPEGASYDEFFSEIDEPAVHKILKKANLPQTAASGFDIKASISINGDVTIESIKETKPVERIEECVVQYPEEETEELESDLCLDEFIDELNSMSVEDAKAFISDFNFD